MSEQPHAELRASEPTVLLVVEDDALLRIVTADFLRHAGYLVMEAASADEAVGTLRRHRDIRLVLADVRMPGALNGFDLAEWVAYHRTDVPVLLTSGCVGEAHLPQRLNWTGRVISKPYRLAEIAARIKALLADPKPSATPQLSDPPLVK